MEDLACNLCEALLTERKASLNKLHIWPLVQRILHNLLVFLDSDGTSRVDNVATSLAVVIYGIDGREDQLFLEMRKLHEIGLGFVLAYC